MKKLLLFLVLISIVSCIEIKNEFKGLPPGTYRAELRLGPNPYPVYDEDAVRKQRVPVFQGVQEDVLPFLMEVTYPVEDSFAIHIINGNERIPITQYGYGVDRRTAHDTIRIEFPAYNSYIHAEFVEEVLQGEFIKRDRANYKIPFVAEHGELYRFKDPMANDTSPDISGKWDVSFQTSDGDEWKAIGEFKQDSNQLLGTFLTETGDYRYLAGNVIGDEAWLSTFDGTHAFLFGAKIINEDSLQGFFKSGIHFYASWTAAKNENAQLTSADSLTIVESPEDIQSISGHDPATGQVVSLADEKYQGKAVILSIMGTWCPNCRDEVNFLKDWKQSTQSDEVAIIGLAFEHPVDTTEAYRAITRYQNLMDIPYDIWYMGKSSKKAASERLPMINQVISYPTMIFLNKEHEVVRVHTGFSGPATSEYESFKNSFEKTIKEIQ